MTRSRKERPSRNHLVRLGSALLVVTAVRVSLKLVALPRLSGWLGLRLGTERGLASVAATWDEVPENTAETLSAVDTILGWWSARSPCLTRALAAGYLLREERPTLRIGALQAGTVRNWAAHAWLEIGDDPLPEPRQAPPVVRGMQRLGRL